MSSPSSGHSNQPDSGSRPAIGAGSEPIEATHPRAEIKSKTDAAGNVIEHTVQIRNALDHFVQQDSHSSCTAAAVLMVRSIRGERNLPSQQEMVHEHQRSLEDLVPGGDANANAVREAIDDLNFKGVFRTDDALFGWELYDAMVPGHLDRMRDRGYLLLSPLITGVPLGSDKVRQTLGLPSNRQMAVEIATLGEPFVVALPTQGGLELNRHAWVVVGVTFSADWEEVIDIRLLDPGDNKKTAAIYAKAGNEFDLQVRTIASVPRVSQDQDWEEALIEELSLCPGFHVRNPLDRNVLLGLPTQQINRYDIKFVNTSNELRKKSLKPKKSICREEQVDDPLKGLFQ